MEKYCVIPCQHFFHVRDEAGFPVGDVDFAFEEHASDFCAAMNFGATLRAFPTPQLDKPHVVTANPRDMR